MQLPIQVPAVIREALHWPAARLFRGLVPSSIVSYNISSLTCSPPNVLCQCPAPWNNTYACCASGQGCHYDSTMCACGKGGMGPEGLGPG
jgi:hypothetical protein